MDTENAESFIAILAFQGAVVSIAGFAAALITHATSFAAGALLGVFACTWIVLKIVSPGPSSSGEWAVPPDATSDFR